MANSFDYVGDFCESLARVKKDDKWGYIKHQSEQIVECKFDYAWDFSEGFAKVKKMIVSIKLLLVEIL